MSLFDEETKQLRDEQQHALEMARIESAHEERMARVEAEAESSRIRDEVALIAARAEHVDTELMLISEENKGAVVRLQAVKVMTAGGVMAVTIISLFGMLAMVCR